jgi:hypothetical protein
MIQMKVADFDEMYILRPLYYFLYDPFFFFINLVTMNLGSMYVKYLHAKIKITRQL